MRSKQSCICSNNDLTHGYIWTGMMMEERFTFRQSLINCKLCPGSNIKQHAQMKLTAKDSNASEVIQATPPKQPRLDFNLLAPSPVTQGQPNTLVAQ